jgi:hypothetical protein
VFGAQPQWPEATLETHVPQLTATGPAIIDTQEWPGRLSFTDVGAIVYYLRTVSWPVPGFSVETHAKHLLTLQRQLKSSDGSTFVARKCLVEAHKSSPP